MATAATRGSAIAGADADVRRSNRCFPPRGHLSLCHWRRRATRKSPPCAIYSGEAGQLSPERLFTNARRARRGNSPGRMHRATCGCASCKGFSTVDGSDPRRATAWSQATAGMRALVTEVEFESRGDAYTRTTFRQYIRRHCTLLHHEKLPGHQGWRRSPRLEQKPLCGRCGRPLVPNPRVTVLSGRWRVHDHVLHTSSNSK